MYPLATTPLIVGAPASTGVTTFAETSSVVGGGNKEEKETAPLSAMEKEQREWLAEHRRKQEAKADRDDEDDEIGPLPHKVMMLTHKEMGRALLPGEGTCLYGDVGQE